MGKLAVHLQEGFDHDSVVIRIAGREAWKGQDVCTHRVLGLAEELVLEAPDPPATRVIEVEVPNRKLSGKRELKPETRQLGISIESGEIAFLELRKSAGYA